jgi:uncharacterized RmlC-like cupin family protein
MLKTGVSTALAALALAAPGAASAGTPEITALPASTLDWQITPEGVAFAGLIGDRFSEPYMAMVRLPAGLSSPPHVKSANMFGVMISGEMVHSALDAGPEEDVVLATGAFYQIPKGLPHVSTCVSTVECVTFLYQDGKFDFLPAGQ